MTNTKFPAILCSMKTMSYNGVLTIYQRAIGLHPVLRVFITDDGAVWMKESGRSTKWHWTYGNPDSDGYPRVKIDGKNRRVHILEAETFLPNPEHKPTVDHGNRIRHDNRLSNLSWKTYKEQAENTSSVINRQDYGVREVEDKSTYMHNYNKVYYQKNKGAALAYRKKYYEEHKEEIIQKIAAYKKKRKGQF